MYVCAVTLDDILKISSENLHICRHLVLSLQPVGSIDDLIRVDFHHCYQLIHTNSHRHKIRKHCDMYIRVKKRHDNHDFQPRALAFPSNLWWGKREWQSRAPYEISNPHTFFFFFRSSVPCVAYVVKPQQILADPDNWDSMIPSRNYPQRAKKVILMKIWWFVTFHTKRWSDDLYPVPGCRGKEKREKWFTVTRNGTKTSGSRWCPLN